MALQFPDLGKHCKHSGCNTLDFLPFQCKSCGDDYCLKHKDNHTCSKSKVEEDKSVLCPLCMCKISV